jgi:dihydrofolate synthase/folylpolyglutamate synthase
MTYKETLDFLFSQLPAFTRIGKAAYKANLDNTIALSESLGNPHLDFKSVHIAGTNGKGSSSHFIASIFQEAGYKTGLFTSPHLKDFRERIRINGKPISKQRVVRFVEENKELFETLKPSFFEMNVALAFSYFAQQKVDIAIIETGLGGRLDSTNIITPELSLITNISFDHRDLLGDTLAKIATEKAGIIKKNVPVIIGEHASETDSVFMEKASQLSANISFAEDEVEWKKFSQQTIDSRMHLQITGLIRKKNIQLNSPLSGHYQLKNLKGVLASVEKLRSLGWNITDENIIQGITNVIKNTGLKGRWDILQTQPLVVADTGHNEAGIKEILEQIRLVKFEILHVVWGMVNDKEISTILSMMPKDACYYFCQAKIPRALDAQLLASQASEFGLHGKIYSSVRAALNAAKRTAKQHDMILVGGSTFVVAEII